jgi:hypothetical protein
MAILLFATESLVRGYIEEAAPWVVLLAQGAAGLGFYTIFLIFSGFSDVRALATEASADLTPVGLKKLILS